MSDPRRTDPFFGLTGEPVARHQPWPRLIVRGEVWVEACERLQSGALTLIDLWGEPQIVHMALAASAEPGRLLVLSMPCPDGRYPSIGQTHPPAIRLERAAADLFGLIPAGLPDRRPWLDHGAWGIAAPLGARHPTPEPALGYPFLPVDAQNIHEIAVGPVHAGIIEPGHFRFSADGETVVRLEERLGYVHKGIEGLIQGTELDAAARLAGRCSGDATVAYASAFSRSVETALGWTPPARAVWLRALMAELERLANHLGDVGAVCNDAAFAIMLAQCSALREEVLRQCDQNFGHRLMMDRVIPGGIKHDLDAPGVARLNRLVLEVGRRFQPLADLYDKTASLQDRTVGTGVLRPQLAAQFGAGGFIGRASGRTCDARRWPGYAPYDTFDFDIPVLSEGDVNARVWIRIREITQSLRLIQQILSNLPTGAIYAPPPLRAAEAAEGAAFAESFRGDVFVWTRIEADGRVGRCRLRDPSWFQWPLLEAVIENNIVADFPLCNKSFNCSYSGHDL
jgi:Ni,Fe-hydrogenase III large subunit